MELLVARNPDPESSLPFLLRLPLGGGLVFRTRGTWPRTSALYCHPVGVDEWPAEPEIVERVALRVCARRGAAIDVVCDRGREQRSQIVFTRARGREVVFWPRLVGDLTIGASRGPRAAAPADSAPQGGVRS